ncbi:MAG: efflux RND transporter periplasmic adaptor subunit [Planctomycetes bacterium]|nr:efflux RND transporter periplasmic adaptor subunit [Planctomycetota bacterium]
MKALYVLLPLALAGAGLALRQHEGHDAAPQDPHAGHKTGTEAEGLPGYAGVTLTPERVQQIGVRTEKARKQALTRLVRSVGIVRTDETLESHIHVKWNGWIEEFSAAYVGQSVRKGDPLFSVYSPDLVTAQHELLIAARRGKLEAQGPAADALDAARTRLKRWDVPDDVIAEVEKAGKVQRTVTIRSPRDGVILERMALPGMYVEPAMTLYTIADLSRVWVLVDLYEYEAPLVRKGMRGRFVPVGGTGEEFPAAVAFVAPTVDATTRTVKVRLELPNEYLRIRPGAYGTALLDVVLPEAVTIPADAVIDTGVRQIVFLAKGQGLFEPRAVRVGSRAGEWVQILQGLGDADEVVTRAQFMLDSESRLRSAGSAGGHAGHGGN